MCYGENNASHCVHFINSQFKTHWEIASGCSNEYNGFKPDVKQHRYSVSLAEFHYGRHRPDADEEDMNDLMFYAQFDAPNVIFLCNHQALVTITVRKGHFNQDHLRASDTALAERSQNVDIESQSFVFRVPFRGDGIAGRSTITGITGSDHTIPLVVFDYRNAEIVHIEPEVVNGRQALEFYLGVYTKFLQSAGHHVLFSLPNFDDEPEGRRLLIDHSRDTQRKYVDMLGLTEVHDIAVTLINRYLSTTWLKAAMLVGAQSEKSLDRSQASIAEYANTWTAHEGGAFFHVRFGAPEVAALCNDEIIVYFVIDEVFFYDSEDFTQEPFRTFSDWRIAVVMEYKYEKPEPEVTSIKIDVTTSRFAGSFSSLGGFDLEESEDKEGRDCLEYVIDFVRHEYLNILESAEYHIIYKHDSRWGVGGGTDDLEVVVESNEAEWHRYSAEDSKLISKTAAWRHIIQNSDVGIYDQVTALSEASINSHFRSSTTAGSKLFEWAYDSYFNVTFEPPTVRLRGDSGAVIVFFHLKSGTLRHLRNHQPYAEGEEYDFAGWRIAFQVSLKMGDHAALLEKEGAEWESTFMDSSVAKEYDGKDVDYRHLYLDFDNVTLLHEFSRFEGLFTGQHKRSIEKVQAAVVYLRDYYLKDFVNSGHHVLYTIPVFRTPSEENFYGLTGAYFHVYTSRASAEQVSIDQTRISHSTILIVGTCEGRGTPAIPLQYWSEWVAHSGRFASYGTVGISNKLFLNNRFLEILSRINAATTIIPSFSGIEKEQWILKLTGWSNHEERKGSACPFGLTQANVSEDMLVYVWRCSDVWDYQHHHGHGDHNVMSGNFSVASTTENYLYIPTVFRPGSMEIKMSGKITLTLNVANGTQWSSYSHATWSASLVVHSEPSGLRVVAAPSQIQIKTDKIDGDTDSPLAIKPDQLLADALPKNINLEEAIGQFVHFEKTWRSCYPGMFAYRLAHPVFSRRGDLLFELLPHSASTPSVVSSDPGAAAPRVAPKPSLTSNLSRVNRRRKANGANGANGHAGGKHHGASSESGGSENVGG
ncbi:uncharacterized protein PHACADRAFT_257614 [Phanerochaete carnosa HHB-10118-sp]|uniref:Uncharacterized protein n=1 Tax=Phanerochaete carnosa (strain HHB-10118-sp) TaxID=650164 RepID=K5W4E2_PHACS|nr:uncharacterized protein PHACADRAFT_257614 [Phanerochaete carnosa HHB-10118-sp]EKM54030.1 hypothetical protein PHACADRAFT_257614 [Phanerochaete carnosa HHB-10118-sp]